MILNVFSNLLNFVIGGFVDKKTDMEDTNDTIHTLRRLLFVFYIHSVLGYVTHRLSEWGWGLLSPRTIRQ